MIFGGKKVTNGSILLSFGPNKVVSAVEPEGDSEKKDTTIFQHATAFLKSLSVVGHMLENIEGEHVVKYSVIER